MIFCTLSNKRYFLQGLALAYSLQEHCKEPYKLYYLCLDEYCYNTLLEINKNYNFNIIPLKVSNLEKSYPELEKLKTNNYSEYCFSFSSLLPKYIFETYQEPHSLYLDSDVYVYSDPKLIFKEIGEGDVGIVRHRHNDSTHYAGEYNCNCVYVKNNFNGNKLLNWWYNAFRTKIPSELSTCGDQKFLEGFKKIIPKDKVIIVDKLVGHGAPWNYRLYEYGRFNETPKKIIWGEVIQEFIFNHFSQFRFNFETDNFNHTGGSHMGDILGGKVFMIEALQNIYIEYYYTLKELNTKLNLNIKNNL